MSVRDVYIVECVRTAVGRGYKNGMFAQVQPVELLSTVLDEVTKRAKIDKGVVEDVITGCVTPLGEQGGNIARMALLKAEFPQHVPGVQLNRMCGSGQQAIHFAAQAIASGEMDCVIACGVESMSRVPMGSDAPWADKEKGEAYRKLFPFKILHQGQSAEMIAEKWNITRDELDKFSGRSHELASEAINKGYFKNQIVPIKINDSTKLLDTDEGVRVPVDYNKMSTLKTVFKENGLITAANASQVSDGASAVLLVSGKKLIELGLKPRARIIATAVVGSDPQMMLTGVIPATKKVLQRANMIVDQIDVFEVNEAFASVVLSWQKEIGADPKKVNPNGGAIATGHPLGATGCVLMTKLVNELERSGGRYGLQTMCIGYGQATATIIENLSSTKNRSKL